MFVLIAFPATSQALRGEKKNLKKKGKLGFVFGINIYIYILIALRVFYWSECEDNFIYLFIYSVSSWRFFGGCEIYTFQLMK